MSQTNNCSTVAVDGSADGWASDIGYGAHTAAENTSLSTHRLAVFMGDTCPASLSMNASPYTTQEAIVDGAKKRMAAKLAAFEQAFNNTSTSTADTKNNNHRDT